MILQLFLMLAFALIAISLIFFILNKIMKKKSLFSMSHHIMGYFIVSIAVIAVAAIIIANTLPEKEYRATKEFTQQKIMKNIKNDQENKYTPYLISEEIFEVRGNEFSIQKREQNKDVYFYVVDTKNKSKNIKVRNYVFPLIKHGYTLKTTALANKINFTKNKKLIISSLESDDVKTSFNIVDLKLNRDYVSNAILNEEEQEVHQLTVVEVPVDMKVHYNYYDTLGSE